LFQIFGSFLTFTFHKVV